MKEEVILSRCIDGDTAVFINDGMEYTYRFLAIDTPEDDEYLYEESSLFVCEKLESAKKIEVEYDVNSDTVDKYNRELVWVFVDNENLQELILKNGLGKIEYIYGDYKYLDSLTLAEDSAKEDRINIWEEREFNYILLISILIVCLSIFLLFIFKRGKK